MKTKDLQRDIEKLEKKLVTRIVQLREQDGNHVEICKKLGVNFGHISMYMRGLRKLSYKKIIEWSIKLKVEI